MLQRPSRVQDGDKRRRLTFSPSFNIHLYFLIVSSLAMPAVVREAHRTSHE